MAPAASERVAQTERALVIFPGALGDLICLGPALRALARRHRDAAPGAALELMARGELARFAVARMVIARSHSIDRREVAALFTDSPEWADLTDLPDLADASRVFRPFSRIYCFFASDDARFRRALEAAAAPGAVSFHAFRPAGAGHVAAAYLDEIGEADAPLDAHIEVLPGDIAEARDALA